MNFKNWKTTAAGVAMFLGAACVTLASDPKFARYSLILTIIASAIGHIMARDKNVSDQDVKARPKIAGVDDLPATPHEIAKQQSNP